jgi:uncharacterized protein (TIGR02145 family)
MKKLLFSIMITVALLAGNQSFAQKGVAINNTGADPDNSAILDVSAANKGLLIPNVALTGTTDAATILSPAVSLLVYNTAAVSDVTPGYYYNSRTSGSPFWTKLSTNGTNPGDMQYWNGTAWIMVAVGLPGQFLQLTASSIPSWSGATFPTLTTNAATAITEKTATSGGNITNDGGGSVTARGVCWATTTNPTISNSKTTNGTGLGAFTSNLTGLTGSTTYYVRAYATNGAGTAYGSEISFTTSLPTVGTVNDNDGNTYNYVTIGTQTWKVENLRTTKYRNGDAIPNVTGDGWQSLVAGAYCWYFNNALTYKATYGALYNWYAVADSRNIAPVGWHVATDAEWNTLTTYLGGLTVAGGNLKETGTSHWKPTNDGATNSSGFTALPGGYCMDYGGFDSIGGYGMYWSSTEDPVSKAWCWYTVYFGSNIIRSSFNKYSGFSVRCVRD